MIVSAQQLPPIDVVRLRALLDLGALHEDVIACIGTAELARRQFHEIARIAGLVFGSYPGSDKSLRGCR